MRNIDLKKYLENELNFVKEKVGGKKVLLGLSGGLDSSVCALLLEKAIGKQLVCIFVDHGFMRLNEGDEIEEVFSGKNLSFKRVNAGERFLSKLSGIIDPEKKRKIIGEEFIRVFEEESRKFDEISFLAQGTIYPDIVESGGTNFHLVKSHHNVGGLPDNMSFEGIIEPLAKLYKNEVRELGRLLDLPENIVNRQPFPGPGLAVRVMGEVTKDKLDDLKLADFIFREEVLKLKDKPSQYFAVMTDTLSVGVKGTERTYDPVVALRAVNTEDFMTAAFTKIPFDVLEKVASRITSEVARVSRVVYDITSKPPGTVEWE